MLEDGVTEILEQLISIWPNSEIEEESAIRIRLENYITPTLKAASLRLHLPANGS